MRLALADALHFRRVQAVYLRCSLPLALLADAAGE
jgi:hypothetical protein